MGFLPSYATSVYTCRRKAQYKMRHVCAYLLAALGSGAPTVASMKAILASVGVEGDEKQMEIVIKKFGDKKIEKLIAEGSALMSAMGGGGAVAASGGGGAAAAAAEEKKEEKKEEKVEEEESDDDMGFGLFD